jgi:SAM-dependent methyltransferase
MLTAAGRWPEADAALTEAVRLWRLGRRSGLRAGALVRLADLRVRQGRLEEAERLLDGIEVDADVDAARPLAAIHLARGQTTLAADVLERALAQVGSPSTAAAPLLAPLVDVHLAANRIDQAEAVAEQLAACAARHASHYLEAVTALARGRVCLAAGTGDPRACLREALAGFSRAQLPTELARARLALANALVAERPEVAVAEARAALEAFERLQLAHKRGATVSGLDASAALLAVAHERLPMADLREGDLEALPFQDDAFEAVTAFNAVQYAADAVAAPGELRRVAASGAPVAVVTWAEPERCETRTVLAAIGRLPPPPPGAGGPFALSAPGRLEELLSAAGLTPQGAGEAPAPFIHPDLDTAVRAHLADGPARRAIEHAGQRATADAIREALAGSRQPDGSYRQDNAFRYVVASP